MKTRHMIMLGCTIALAGLCFATVQIRTPAMEINPDAPAKGDPVFPFSNPEHLTDWTGPHGGATPDAKVVKPVHIQRPCLLTGKEPNPMPAEMIPCRVNHPGQ